MFPSADNQENSVLCGLKTEAEEENPEIMDNDGVPLMMPRGSSPLSDSMMSEADNELLINEFTPEIPCEAESNISSDIYGADLQRTLGEILAYCQITYGAILKLDEKFEMLQAKVASIQNPTVPAQKVHLSSSSSQAKSDSVINSDTPMPHLVHISSTPPLSSTESRKPPPLSPGPAVPSPPPLLHQSRISTAPDPLQRKKMSLIQQHLQRVKSRDEENSEIRGSDSAAHQDNTSCLGSSERKVFISSFILQRAGKMTRPSAAVRYLLRNIFTTKELSQSSTTGNPSRCLLRLDTNKVDAIREWAVKRYPKFDLRESGKDWKVCLAVINSTARYYRFMDKTRRLKMREQALSDMRSPVWSEPAAVSSVCAATAEIDVELSDSDSEHKQPKLLVSPVTQDYETPADWDADSVYLGPPHRGVKVPEFALSAAHLRTRPELVARYLIRFIFPEDVLVNSNVYGGVRRGIHALDHNKISALREHLSERFPWMKLQEDGSDWKVCVGSINSAIRKFRYERKMGKKKSMR
ncbi:uncharacterized protein isoform X1 [Danio rerio]|uniref:Uncharacterized protein isoform X1 n=1 Tax=Danio rerio TaxID=7955 RepID=A0AC58IKK1_DANRE